MAEDKKEEKKEEIKSEEKPQGQKEEQEPEGPQNKEKKDEEITAENKPAEEQKPQEESKPQEEIKKEKPAPEPEKKGSKPAPTGKFKDIIKQIEELSVVDLAELVKALEERFGVSAAAPVAAAPTAGGTGAPAGEEAEEKTEFTVILKAAGEQKINVIKAIREINPDLGLKEAKDIADQAPKEVKKEVTKKEAEEAKAKLEAAGAQVELK